MLAGRQSQGSRSRLDREGTKGYPCDPTDVCNPAMPPIILHHFDASPFAEKIRLVLGFRDIAWLGVQIPMVMPKPDVVALSGGYRKTPLLQIGADVYADTALIARVLDGLGSGPTLYPAAAPLAPAMAQWADWQLFWAVVDFASQPAAAAHRWRDTPPEVVAAIVADRTPFRAKVPRQTPADASANLQPMLTLLGAQVDDGRHFLFGMLTIADLAVAHCLWHLRRAGPVADAALAPHPKLLRWHDGLLARGHGRWREIPSAQALAIAAGATQHAACSVLPGLGFELGQRVSVAATDYGTDAVGGTLVGLTPQEVVIERSDARAGTLHVHFPRHGFHITTEG